MASGRPRQAVTSFVSKLYEMLEKPEYHSIISWAPNGDSFVVHSMTEMQQSLLPHYFKHSNFSSFVRQLNLYRFTKIGESTTWEFRHENFRKDHPELLTHVRRIAPTDRFGMHLLHLQCSDCQMLALSHKTI